MPFPPALTATQLDTCRTAPGYGDLYMLFWDQAIIFQAQINQASFTSSFASITFDNVSVGAYTDIKADFICYVASVSGNILTPEHRFRVRADGAGAVSSSTVLNINETSADLTDDWYIMVVKDVGCEAKVPKTITAATPASYDYARDYAITYRHLMPIVYGLQSVYVGVLNSSGYVDFPWTAQVLITDADASTSTWLWDIDGLGFEVGSSSTATITARATAAGQYMPRVTYTDNQGNTNYFTFRVFVVPADYSSVVNLATTSPSTTRDTVNGHTLRLNANAVSHTGLLTRIDQLPDLCFCAVWYDSNQPLITDNILFVGWITGEAIENTYGPNHNRLLNTQFQIDGITARLGDTISRRVQMVQDATPTVFGDIKTLTPWRAVAYFLTEHTTLTNICSVEFDDTSTDFQYPRFGSSDSSALDSIISLIFTINGSINYAASGEISIDRIGWMVSTTARTALTTVANFTTTDMGTSENGGLLFNLSRQQVPTIGREMSGGGIYNTTTAKVQVLKATTPSVAQSQGNQLTTFNRQVLLANSDINTGGAELGQRVADDMAARQPQTLLSITFPPSSYAWMVPHQAQWYTWTISATENNRDISYTTATRWTLRSMTLGYDASTGTLPMNGVFQKETQGTSYQTMVTLPIDGQVQYYHPVMPVAPTYADFPEDANANLADPTAPAEEDDPPFSPEDVAVVNWPQSPLTTVNNSYVPGGEGMVWDDDSLWGVKNIHSNPVYTDYTPSTAGTITNGKFDPFGKRALAISNDGTDTLVHRTKAFGDLQWTDTEVLGSIYLKILPVRVIDKVYIGVWRGSDPWAFTYDFTVDNGSWTANNPGWGARGHYVAATGWTSDQIDEGANHNEVVNIYKEFDDTVVTSITMTYDYTEGQQVSPPNLDTYIEGWIDGFGTTQVFQEFTDSSNGSGLTYQWTGSETLDAIDVQIRPGFRSGTDPSPTGEALITKIVITGTGTNPFGGSVATKFSDDWATTFESEVEAGDLTGTFSGSTVKMAGSATTVFVGIDDTIQAATNGGAYSAQADGDTTGSYALAMASFYGAGDAFVYGTAAAVGGETLWIVNNGAVTAITPNDGVDDGIVATESALAMAERNSLCIFGLFDFGGTVKFAYSADQGVTWQINTQVTDDAKYILVKLVNGLFNIYICDLTSLWWGSWDGLSTSTITLQEKGTPSLDLKGIELR